MNWTRKIWMHLTTLTTRMMILKAQKEREIETPRPHHGPQCGTRTRWSLRRRASGNKWESTLRNKRSDWHKTLCSSLDMNPATK
ncbi:MAG: hypothetical protein KF784_02235 [Fimbriimonadaceae bacterium]|nr:hypothetical protein [Fimbriimonadaceae bacterium]